MLKTRGVFLFLVDTLYSEKELSNFIFTKYSTDTKLIFPTAFKAWTLLFLFFLLKIIKVHRLL